jgi:N-formylmaleamate deformylase
VKFTARAAVCEQVLPIITQKGKNMLPHWTEEYVDVDGVRIHYTRTGGNKPPLVLLHGFSDAGLCWLPVALELEADYDVILPDAVGHGKSQRVEPGQQTDMAANAAGLIRALGLEQPVLGGHSMGANVASRVEARFPGLVRALILEDPAWFDPDYVPPPPKEDGVNPFHAFLKQAKDQAVEEVMAGCREENPDWPEVELRPWAVSKQQFDPNFLDAKDNNERNWPEVVEYLNVPTLLITAGPEKWAIVSEKTSARLAEQYDNIRVAHIENSGHSIRRDNFSAYMAAVRSFLQELA